jgi:hypothetical protein
VVGSILEHSTQHSAIASKALTKSVKYYNLDAIIAVEYRVNPKRATQFRIWATKILKEYIIKGFTMEDERLKQVDRRVNIIRKKYIEVTNKGKEFILKHNDILMARTGATFAKLLYRAFNFASYLIKIDFIEKIENELYWFFTKTRNYWEQANSLSAGVAQPHFNGKALKQVVFSYPKEIDKQKDKKPTLVGFLLPEIFIRFITPLAYLFAYFLCFFFLLHGLNGRFK